MNINSLNRGANVYKSGNDFKKKYQDDLQSQANNNARVMTDKLELSEDAMKLASVKQKISEGFYDTPEVLRNTALKLYNELPPDAK